MLSHKHTLMLQLHFFYLPPDLITLRLNMGDSCLLGEVDALDQEADSCVLASVSHKGT